jgi:3-dehydroquinate dehydratase-2
MKIAVINGPNLNLTGQREKHIYGSKDFATFIKELREEFPAHEISYFQSNIEGELIDQIHSAGTESEAMILNAGGYTHTSVAIADAVRAIDIPVIEVHMSNTFSREDYRHRSLTAPWVKGIIIGFGMESYRLAILSLFRNQ